MPEDYLDLPALRPNVEHTFMSLCRFAAGNRYSCWPSIAAIATKAKYSPRTVERHLDILDSLHLIKRIRRVRTSDYYIICHKLKANFREAIQAAMKNLPAHANAHLTMKEWQIIIKCEKLNKRISDREYRSMMKDTKAA